MTCRWLLAYVCLFLFAALGSSSKLAMKAAVLYGKEDVRVEDVQVRPLQPGEVRVAIGEMSGVDCGLLTTAYEVFRAGTLCEHASLTIDRIPARWHYSRLRLVAMWASTSKKSDLFRTHTKLLTDTSVQKKQRNLCRSLIGTVSVPFSCAGRARKLTSKQSETVCPCRLPAFA